MSLILYNWQIWPFHRFDKAHALGQAILDKDPNAPGIREKLQKLADDEKLIAELWNKKQQELLDARDLQIFLREADQIDSVTASHEAFLDFGDLGVSDAFNWS